MTTVKEINQWIALDSPKQITIHWISGYLRGLRRAGIITPQQHDKVLLYWIEH